jgi:hypothetical protein
MNMKKWMISSWIACLGFMPLHAQHTRHITVSAEDAYTDHIALSTDSRDMDIMVKFQFDEAHNQLVVSLITYRSLFVFEHDVRYKTVFKHRKLNAMKLPYVVEDEATTEIMASKALKKQLNPTARHFIFKHWIEYEGLQPIPQNYQLAHEFVEQTFDILHMRNEVSVSLRHLMVMDAQKGNPNKRSYLLSYLKDTNLDYRITLRRNPCLGTEKEQELADHSVEAIRQGYESLLEKFLPHEVYTAEQCEAFYEMKQMLGSQYPKVAANQPCDLVRGKWELYNTYVDSIASAQCKINPVTQEDEITGVEVELLYSKARQLDGMVTRWLNSEDAIERKDLQLYCLKMVKDVNEWVSINGLANSEQQKAWGVFQKAEKYYQQSMVKNTKRKNNP